MSSMSEQRAVARRVLGTAGREMRLRLIDHYGSPEATEKAICEQAEQVAELEDWGTRCNLEDVKRARQKAATFPAEVANSDDHIPDVIRYYGVEFGFEQIPAPLRQDSVIAMAAAFLMWKLDQRKAGGV